jgi:hypothetical protein
MSYLNKLKFWHKKPQRVYKIRPSDMPNSQERSEYEDVLNAAMNGGPNGVIGIRGEDGKLSIKKLD